MAMNPAELAAQAAQRKTAMENPDAVSYDPTALDQAMGEIMGRIDEALAADSATDFVGTPDDADSANADSANADADAAEGDHSGDIVSAFEKAHHTLHETLENNHVPTQVAAQPVEGSV